jgi:Protein of unknown function, DUF481
LLLVCICLLFTTCACFGFEARKKTDVVYMRNGDKITCEVKALTQGQLTIKPDYTSVSIVLDWNKVARIESTQQFVVTDPEGASYIGSLTGDAQTRSVTIVKPESTTLPQASVVQISELGVSFVKRMTGDISLGLGLAQSNSQKTLTTQGDLGYQGEKNRFNLTGYSQFVTQEEATDTDETTVKSSLFHQLDASNWWAGGIANFLSSSEQKVALQTTLGAAMSRRVIFTNKTNLRAAAGLGWTITRDDSGTMSTGKTHLLDSALSVQYSTFRFDSTTFNTTFWIYPSLSSPGRVRLTLNQDLYYKFFGNFFLSFSFYDNYDNQPVVGAPSNNTGASTQIGWSFP